jgi:hypothetical protein
MRAIVRWAPNSADVVALCVLANSRLTLIDKRHNPVPRSRRPWRPTSVPTVR